MKKFWIVLLALGLVAGFAMSAPAADVKFSGSYYAMGIYADNPQMRKDADRTYGAQAFIHNRLRIQTEFKVAEGLVLVTRFDALEKAWGYGLNTSGTAASTTTADAWRGHPAGDSVNRWSTGNQYARVQENLEFERAYVDFTTKVGRFMVGYQNFLAWGTTFLDTHITRPGIKYLVPIGPLTLVAAYEKGVEQNAGANTTLLSGYATDADAVAWDLGLVFKFGAGDAGILYQYADRRATRALLGYKQQMHFFNPYAKMKFGPFYVEAEAIYGFGDYRKYDSNVTGTDISGAGYGAYVMAQGDFGPAYVGGIAAFMSGDDPSTADKREGTLAGATELCAGQAWDPMLILFNDGIYGAQHRLATPVGAFFDNAMMFQVFAGFKPVKQADLMVSVTYAKADQYTSTTRSATAFGTIDKEMGWEVDVTGKYKIFDNLEYMVGAGYLMAGDYFKTSTLDKANNYMLFHKLTLSF